MMFLQCPHQGAYHMTSLGRLASSSTTSRKLAAVRYLLGPLSQSAGSGSVK
jgi:hypothetical protein